MFFPLADPDKKRMFPKLPKETMNHCPACDWELSSAAVNGAGSIDCPNCGKRLWAVRTEAAIWLFDLSGLPHATPPRNLESGQTMRITSGTFKNFTAVVAPRSRSPGHATVTIDVFGRAALLGVPVFELTQQ